MLQNHRIAAPMLLLSSEFGIHPNSGPAIFQECWFQELISLLPTYTKQSTVKHVNLVNKTLLTLESCKLNQSSAHLDTSGASPPGKRQVQLWGVRIPRDFQVSECLCGALPRASQCGSGCDSQCEIPNTPHIVNIYCLSMCILIM